MKYSMRQCVWVYLMIDNCLISTVWESFWSSLIRLTEWLFDVLHLGWFAFCYSDEGNRGRERLCHHSSPAINHRLINSTWSWNVGNTFEWLVDGRLWIDKTTVDSGCRHSFESRRVRSETSWKEYLMLKWRRDLNFSAWNIIRAALMPDRIDLFAGGLAVIEKDTKLDFHR